MSASKSTESESESGAAPQVRVWDRPLRVLHALFALSVCATWITGAWWADPHEALGYVVGAVVLARGVWGLSGNRYARFRQFVRPLAATLHYAKQLWSRTEPRYLGHNPLGGWMTVALLAIAASAKLSGILYTTDWLWGYAWLHDLHATLAWTMVALVVLHLGGVAFTIRRHREPLASAMLHGRKPAPRPEDVDD